MKKLIAMSAILGLMMTGLAPATASPTTTDEDSMFIIHDLTQGPEKTAANVRRYVEEHEDWLFLAEFGLMGGAVTAMKICYLPIGQDIGAAGMQVTAMMPCGHLAFYEEDGQSRLSRLSLEFMTTLHPDPNLERAVLKGEPALTDMLEEVLD